MLNLVELRENAREIFNSALRAVDAYEATRHSIILESSLLRIEDSRFEVSQSPIYVVGIGKASLSMAQGVEEQLSGILTRGDIHCQTKQAWQRLVPSLNCWSAQTPNEPSSSF